MSVTRRSLLTGVAGTLVAAAAPAQAQLWRPVTARPGSAGPGPSIILTPSGSVSSTSNGQTIQNLDITGYLTVTHDNVTVQNCKVRHTQSSGRWAGVYCGGVDTLVINNLDIIRLDTNKVEHSNITIENCPGARVTNIRARGGSGNIYVTLSAGTWITNAELYDTQQATPPFVPHSSDPRGQGCQFGASPNSIIQDFSTENSTTSFTEDNINCGNSAGCIIRRGLIVYNNGWSGVGVLFEAGSNNVLCEDVDIVGMGNGALTFYVDGGTARRVRAKDGHACPAERPPVGNETGCTASNGLTFGAIGGGNTFTQCQYFNPANPNNVVYAPGNSVDVVQANFTPRAPIRLVFPWE